MSKLPYSPAKMGMAPQTPSGILSTLLDEAGMAEQAIEAIEPALAEHVHEVRLAVQSRTTIGGVAQDVLILEDPAWIARLQGLLREMRDEIAGQRDTAVARLSVCEKVLMSGTAESG